MPRGLPGGGMGGFGIDRYINDNFSAQWRASLGNQRIFRLRLVVVRDIKLPNDYVWRKMRNCLVNFWPFEKLK